MWDNMLPVLQWERYEQVDRGSQVAIKLLSIGSPSDHTFPLQVVELFPSEDPVSFLEGGFDNQWLDWHAGSTALQSALCSVPDTLLPGQVRVKVSESSDRSLSAGWSGGASSSPHCPLLVGEELAVLCHGQRKPWRKTRQIPRGVWAAAQWLQP